MFMTRFINNLKTTVLLALIIALFAGIGGAIWGVHGLILGFLFGGVSNLIAYFYSDRIALMSTGAREVSESEAPQLYRIVRDLADADGLPMPKVYVTPQAAPNAFATGRNPSHAVVACTEGILRLCNEQELRGTGARDVARQAPGHADQHDRGHGGWGDQCAGVHRAVEHDLRRVRRAR